MNKIVITKLLTRHESSSEFRREFEEAIVMFLTWSMPGLLIWCLHLSLQNLQSNHRRSRSERLSHLSKCKTFAEKNLFSLFLMQHDLVSRRRESQPLSLFASRCDKHYWSKKVVGSTTFDTVILGIRNDLLLCRFCHWSHCWDITSLLFEQKKNLEFTDLCFLKVLYGSL